MEPIVEIKDLTAGVGLTPILMDINWTCHPGEHWLITGPMASGKTTFCKVLSGDTRTFSGKCRVAFLKDQFDLQRRRQLIKLVSFTDTGKLFSSVNAVHYYQQRYNTFDSDGHMTVKDYLNDGGLDLSRFDHQELLQLFELNALLDTERIKLSSGQTRKLILCKAFLEPPRILILDNLHIGLDDGSRKRINAFIDRLSSQLEITIILAGHFRSVPGCITHELSLDRGKIIEARRFYHGSKREYVLQLNDDQQEALQHLQEMYVDHKSQSFHEVIRFKDVAVKYPSKTVMEHINWTVKAGEKWVLFGQNGSGKSTLLSLMYGDHPQAYGHPVYLFEKKRGTGESIWDVKKKIGFTSPELHAYFSENLTAREVVLTGLWDAFTVKKAAPLDIERLEYFFIYFGLSDILEEPYIKLSTGQQRLLFLIRAFIKQAPVYLLDEPYQGLDEQSRLRAAHLLEVLIGESDTLIFISHFEDEIPASVEHRLELN